MKSQVVVLCEGYDDRGFWAGWLRYLKGQDLFVLAEKSTTNLKKLITPYSLQPGDFCFSRTAEFSSSGEDLISVRPCKGAGKLWSDAKEIVAKHQQPTRLVINVDSDRPAEEEPVGGRVERLQQLVEELTGTRPRGNPPYHAGKTQIDLIVWHCLDAPGTLGVPDKQTLERLVCAAIVAASASTEYPAGWAASVRDFLHQEPRGGDGPKSYAHAYWAKYFVDEMDDLFQAVWSSELFPAIASQLELRLKAIGAWQVAHSLVHPAEDSR